LTKRENVGKLPTWKNAVPLEEAVDLVRYCAEQGEIRWGKHFTEELANECLTIPDAWWILRTGRIYDPPERDIKTGEWKYRIEGHEPEGKWLIVVFSFKSVDKAFLITVFSVEARRRGAK